MATDADRLSKTQRKAQRGGLVRRSIAGLLVVLFAVLLPITLAASWTHRTVLDTDTYVSTLGPIAEDPAVTAAVGRDLTNQLYAALDPQAVIAGALPPNAAFLAGPIANAARGQLQEAVTRVLDSDQFQQLWTGANRFAHAQVVGVLRGHSNVLQTTRGQVVLNLVPLLDAAVARATALVGGVVGRRIDIPTVSAIENPAAACARISAAIGRPLPDTCAQIALFPAKNLIAARRAVQIFDRAVLLLLIVTPLVFLAALWVSRRRRRTLLQLAIGGLLGLVVVRRALMWEQDNLVNNGPAANKGVRHAIVHGLLGGFFDLTWWFVLGTLVVAVVATVTGPYGWAVATRRHTSAAAHHGRALVTVAVSGGDVRPEDRATVSWVRQHIDLLRVAGPVVAVILLLAFSINVWGFLAIAVLLALYEVGLHRLRPPAEVTLPSQPTDTPSGGQPASQPTVTGR